MMPRPLEPHGDLVISVRGLAREGAFQDVALTCTAVRCSASPG